MTYKGGNEARGGFYWKKGEWEIVTVEGKTGTLPGGSESRYMRLPGLFVVPVALIVSVAYVVFLPVVGFAMLFRSLIGKMGGGLVKKTTEERAMEKEASAGQSR